MRCIQKKRDHERESLYRFISICLRVRRNRPVQIKTHSFPSGKERFFRLAAMPPAGLLRDNPPKARLRIRRCACICHRQRLAPDLQRKATRESVLWTPRKGGEPKVKTRVAAYAVRRGWRARVSLPLRGTSDRAAGSAPARGSWEQKAARTKSRHCEPVLTLAWQSVFRADDISPYRRNPGFSSQKAQRTVRRSGMDFVPELYHIPTIAMPSHRAVQRFIAWAPFSFFHRAP